MKQRFSDLLLNLKNQKKRVFIYPIVALYCVEAMVDWVKGGH